MLLVIDQFEEAFTLCHDSGERRCFIQALAALAGDPDSRASVVLGVRADFYARCSEQPDLVALLQDNQVLVGPMTAAELRQAIEGPAERAGLTLEAGLATTILGDLGEEPGSLPLLSHALFATWQHRQDHTLTLAGYQATGGVRQAIAKTAETVYQALTSAEQAVAKGVFLRLTALGEGTEDTRRRVRRAELLTGQDADLVAVVLDRLATARLISLDEDNVDVAHEALIREWPTLRRWLADDREGLRTHRQLTESAIEWERLGRDADALYRGARLARASDWAHHNQPRLNRLEQEFLVASRAQERSEIEVARRRNRRLRVLAGSLAALLVLVSVTSVFAIQQRRTAVQQRQAAVRQRDSAQLQGDIASSRELAAEAEAKSISDPQLAALLSLAAFKLNDTVEARVGLLHQVERLHDARRFLTGHTDVVNDVAFSPDGRTLASSSDDGKVILWDMTRHARLATLTGYGVAFSPDGRTLASTSDNGKLLLWDVVRRARLATLTAFTSEYHRVLSVAFSPDGRTLASYTSDDDKIVLWDVARRVRRAILPGPGADGPGGMAFSPDGRILVSGDGHAVDFWDVARRTRVASVPGDTTIVAGVAFSPDGRTVASGSDNGKVILWDASRHTRLATMTAGASKFGMVAFSPDGHTLAAGTEGADGQIVLWDVARRARMATLTAYSGNGTEATASVAFSPDGRTLASGGDNNVTLWNAHPQPALGAAPTTLVVDLRNLPSDLRDLHGAAFSPDRQGFTVVAVNDRGELVLWDVVRRVRLATLPGDTGEVTIAFSPDGHVLAAAEDGKLVLWDVARRTRLATLKTGVYGDVVFSPNGRLLTIVSGRASITLWDVARHTQMATLTGHTGTVRDVAFSPDGRTLASASEDNSIIVWDVARRTRLATLTGHTDSVGTVAFSPDGRTLASGSVDRKLILWDVARRTRLATATAHAEQVLGVAFSPDGRMLASVSEEGRTILWDVTRRSQPTSMATLAGFVVAPSPDGRTLAGVTDDGKLLFWDVDVASWQRRLCAIVGRDLTRDEWATYLPGRLYQHTCD